MSHDILLIGEAPSNILTALHGQGCALSAVADLEAAGALLEAGATPDLVLLACGGDSAGQIDSIEALRAMRPELPVVALSDDRDDQAIAALAEAGAADVVELPASAGRVGIAVANAARLNALTGQVSRLARRGEGETIFRDLVGDSPAMRRVGDLAGRAAASNISVLIEGESGVGKEIVARSIQGSSERAGKPFVAVNCGAIPENLVESILFGHEKGSFTGASNRHVGKFQEADGGTLFLDEIGELRPDIQVKLLRALQESEIDLVGGKQPVKIDVRLISATNRDLAERVREGAFREDLYYRLNVFPIDVPPLRERREDIPALVDHFVSTFAASERKDIDDIAPEAMARLVSYDWPGNVRQLENMIYRAVVLADGLRVELADLLQLPAAQNAAPIAISPLVDEPLATAEIAAPDRAATDAGASLAIRVLDEAGELRPLDDVEAELIRLAIQRHRGHMSEVARRLGIGRSTLYRKIREYGIESRGFGSGHTGEA